MSRSFLLAVGIGLLISVIVPTPTMAQSKSQIADQMADVLQQDVRAFFSHAVDRRHGGFTPNFDADWKRADEQSKFIVFQARMTWIAAELAYRRPKNAGRLKPLAEHGAKYLESTMWDARHGGFYWELNEEGMLTPDLAQTKELYGQAFAIYAAANASRVLDKNSGALDLAIRGYQWVEAHLHDQKDGGYFDTATLDGAPILQAQPGTPPQKAKGAITPFGYKSMNSHIHLLEAYTELYRVWPDAELKKSMTALFHIVRDVIAVDPGCLGMIYTRDWRAVPYTDSFGHDVETAYLLMETAEVLKDPALIQSTWPIARKLDDHALAWGFDDELGGLYDTAATAFGGKLDTTKVWWVQAEALNSLLLMHDQFEKGDTGTYWDAFVKTWTFVNAHMIDHERGGWYGTLTREGALIGSGAKSNNWKACYHTTRALLNCIDRLR